ncbi:MAG: hypothetical protein IJE42_00065 [Bacteroidaceae bacterium]|nr:hypothetical protein [Bacteroidaceae bacterium]
MATNNYIAAIEIGSSKLSGAIGIETYSGIKIMAYASESVNGFITKGVVRNVDETGKSLNSLINRLESQLNDVTIEKAYIAFGGLSMHSVKSSVTREFDTYTKITQEIIDDMSLENDAVFAVPEGYQKVQVLPLEYKLNGDKNIMPIGTPTKNIQCNYLNIVVREQYMKQLEESFEMANVKIMDSFNAARIDADVILSEEDITSGTALVNIGAETTTVAIYSGKLLRKLTVIPLGSSNITKDLCSEQIPMSEAEQIKIFRGYTGAQQEQNNNNEKNNFNQIIAARMSEILQNIKYQIETSGEDIGRIVFTGGGSKLKGLSDIIADNLQSFKIKITNGEELSINNDDNLELTTGAITPTLFGLLSRGKENCCKENIPVVSTPVQQQQPQPVTNLFGDIEPQPEPETEKTVTKRKPKQNKNGLFDKFLGGLKKAGGDFLKEVADDEDDNSRDLFNE